MDISAQEELLLETFALIEICGLKLDGGGGGGRTTFSRLGFFEIPIALYLS